MITADAIDADFVPRPRADVAYVELDGEIVLTASVEAAHYDTHWLDAVASLVWKCFDGASTVAEIVDDLHDAVRADREVVERDVLELARILARAGLFEDVEADRPKPVVPGRPEGLAAGDLLPDFVAFDLDGARVTHADLRGRRTLLVNWSPNCVHCRNIARAIGEAQPGLERAGVDLILVAHGDAAGNRALLADTGIACTVLLQDDFPAFRGIGTPAAYVLDAGGRVERGLVIGSVEVPELVKELRE